MPAETLIIVPTYNERENLPELVRRLGSLPVAVDLLVVDDNSPDGTGRIADDLAAQHPWVHLRDGRRFFAQPGRHPTFPAGGQ